MVSPHHISIVLERLYPYHHPTMLEQLGTEGFTSFQLLVATLLSSRTKDSTTIPLVRKLFQKYPTPQHFVDAPLRNLKQELYGIGFYNVKSKHVKQLSEMIIQKHHGKIPDTFDGLTSLPGVGRKTANCILNYAFHQPAIAVDTHVHRIANRLGWVKTTTPEETEEELMKIVPQQLWGKVNMLLVDHGQRVCLPRNPKCTVCPVRKWCEFGKKIVH